MIVAKWGNSLAVQIPKRLVQELRLKPGDKVRIARAGDHAFEVRRELSRQEALEEIRKHRIVVPDGYVFDRDEIYDT